MVPGWRGREAGEGGGGEGGGRRGSQFVELHSLRRSISKFKTLIILDYL